MENIEKAAKNNAITFQIGIAQMILMPVVKKRFVYGVQPTPKTWLLKTNINQAIHYILCYVPLI